MGGEKNPCYDYHTQPSLRKPISYWYCLALCQLFLPKQQDLEEETM